MNQQPAGLTITTAISEPAKDVQLSAEAVGDPDGLADLSKTHGSNFDLENLEGHSRSRLVEEIDNTLSDLESR